MPMNYRNHSPHSAAVLLESAVMTSSYSPAVAASAHTTAFVADNLSVPAALAALVALAVHILVEHILAVHILVEHIPVVVDNPAVHIPVVVVHIPVAAGILVGHIPVGVDNLVEYKPAEHTVAVLFALFVLSELVAPFVDSQPSLGCMAAWSEPGLEAGSEEPVQSCSRNLRGCSNS